METITYMDGGTRLTGFLARPAGTPKAAIALYPTVWNPTAAVRSKALALADAGYLVLICDFYGQTPESIEQARAFSADFWQSPAIFRNRIQAGLSALTSLEEAKALPLAAIGFCMGGRAVLELARLGLPLAAVVSFHGLLGAFKDSPAAPGSISARILVCHGDADALVPRSKVVEFWEEMDRAGANWHFHSYSGVPHGFTLAIAADGSPAANYDPSADRQSWAAMHSLFDEVFG